MATMSAIERTEEQMRGLLQGAGRQLRHIWRADNVESECIIEVVAL